MTENNKKQNSISSMALFNEAIYLFIIRGGGIRSLFSKMVPIDSEWRDFSQRGYTFIVCLDCLNKCLISL